MLPYWIMFLVPSVIALSVRPVLKYNADGTRRVRVNLIWMTVVIVFSVLIGFRYQVGGDWYNYFRYIWQATALNYSDLLSVQDPGFMAINIFSVSNGWGVTGVNFFGGIIFSLGLVIFCRSLPRPWLGLAIAVPYLIIVVGMGYSRQAIALGLVMIGLVALRRRKLVQFAIWVALGALFHKSAVLMIAIAVLASPGARFQSIGLVGVIGFFAYDAFLADYSEQLVDVYINRQLTESQGAFIRLFMNAVPALLYLIYRKRFDFSEAERRLWAVLSVIAVLMLVALLGTGYSTALDRIGLYFIPLQLVVFSALPDVFGRAGGKNTAVVMGIIFYYAAVLFVWLNFAGNAAAWVPYRMGLSLNPV